MAQVVWVVRVGLWFVWNLPRRWRRPPRCISLLIEGPLPELLSPPGPRWQRFLRRPVLSVQDLGARLRLIADDKRVEGIVVHLRPMALPAATVASVSALIAEYRARGGHVTCWSTGYTASTFEIAAGCDEVLLQPGGEIGSLGLAHTYLYLKDALGRAGVEADFVQVSPYKTAGDVLARSGMTPQAREMADWLADEALRQRTERIAAGRRLTPATLTPFVDRSPLTDQEAMQATLIDGICTEEELEQRRGHRPVPWAEARRHLPSPRPSPPGRYVALLRVEGTIVDGHSRRPPFSSPLPLPFLLADQCGDLTVVEQARWLARDRRVGAVVLWVDSGGGSASASEAMTSALRALAERKPLVGVMGTVAASGGYYVLTPCRRIYARAGTVTGSIGVLTGKVSVGALLDRLDINREVVARGANATTSLADRRLTEDQRDRMKVSIDRIYGLFLERVASGRERPLSEIQAVAGGRVWSGSQALGHGLVDEIGGLGEATRAARQLAGLRTDAPLREARGRHQIPTAGGAAGAAAHAVAAITTLSRARVWLLCPLLSDG